MKALITFPSMLCIALLAAPSARADDPGRQPKYTTAEIWIGHANRTPADKIRISDPKQVTELAAHFPGILGARGTGPRTSADRKGVYTILFHPESGDVSEVRVAHLDADLTSWWWRDNPPYTGDRQVEGVDALRKLLDALAASATPPPRTP